MVERFYITDGELMASDAIASLVIVWVGRGKLGPLVRDRNGFWVTEELLIRPNESRDREFLRTDTETDWDLKRAGDRLTLVHIGDRWLTHDWLIKSFLNLEAQLKSMTMGGPFAEDQKPKALEDEAHKDCVLA